MVRQDSTTAAISCAAIQKEWRRPELRKLPIAATSSGKAMTTGDDGNCSGKGESHSCVS
jgi:hypothetical protein